VDWLGPERLHQIGPSPADHATLRYASLRVIGGVPSETVGKRYRREGSLSPLALDLTSLPVRHGRGGGALELGAGVGTITDLGAAGRVSGADALSFSGFGAYVGQRIAHQPRRGQLSDRPGTDRRRGWFGDQWLGASEPTSPSTRPDSGWRRPPQPRTSPRPPQPRAPGTGLRSRRWPLWLATVRRSTAHGPIQAMAASAAPASNAASHGSLALSQSAPFEPKAAYGLGISRDWR